MKNLMKQPQRFPSAYLFVAVVMFVGIGGMCLGLQRRASAACASPGTDYGTVSVSLNVPAATTYRLWSRIMTPDTSNTSYLLEVDGGNCYVVGGGSIAASAWTWIDYQNGAPTSKVQQALSKGTHSLKFIGNKPGVKLDRVVAVSDFNCTPTGAGDNCNAPSDTTPPTVTLTAPTEGATVSGNASLMATASDNVGVTKVEFYDNSTLIGTDTTSPYGVTWNSTAVPNATHVISARAYDAAGNVSSDSSTVTTKNGDTQPPTAPTNLKATATAYNTVKLQWTTSTDNIGVTGYTIMRDGVPVGTVGAATAYTDTGLSANTTYTYQVIAFDAAANNSSGSSKVSVKTPTVADSQPPSKPIGLSATAVSPTQVNLKWTTSTDNIGVTGYDVYRSTAGSGAKKIGTSPTTSFGDTNLTANTTYSYYVIAKDASNNQSQASDTVTIKTPQPPQTVSSISGTIKSASTNKPIPFARVVLTIDGHRHIYQTDQYGRYAIFNLKTGRYNATYRATGYYSQTLSLQLGTAPLTQDMTLRKR